MLKNPDVVFINLGAKINRLMQEHHVPGVSVGVLYNGQTYTAGFGVTNVEHSLPVNDDTLFQIGSITKTFVATLLMRLVETGKLELDATIRTYLPDFKLVDEEAATQATIRHLLTHMGNWVGDFFIDTDEGDDASARYMAEMASLKQLAPLGSVFSYNNAGFYLAGHLIETVTGQTFDVALREMLLDPLGMEQCYLKPTDVMTRRFATGHRADGEMAERKAQVARPWPLPRAAWAAGGLITNVKELLRYARFQMGDGSTEELDEEGAVRPLSPNSMAQMQTPQATIWGENEQMGLSWFIDDTHGVRSISHSGGTTGQISLLQMIPEHEFAIVILTNCATGGKICQAAYHWALREYLNVEPVTPIAMDTPADQLSSYVGRYTRPMTDIELVMDGDQLMLHLTHKAGFPSQNVSPAPSPPPMPCTLCEPDRLLIVDGPMKDSLIDVIRGKDGNIRWVRMGRIYGLVTGDLG